MSRSEEEIREYLEGTTRSIRNIYWQEWKSIVKRTLKGLLQTEDITERERKPWAA